MICILRGEFYSGYIGDFITGSDTELFRVTYTDLERLLKPRVYSENNENMVLKTENIGIFKRVEWQDQQEWRYRLHSLPLSTYELAHDSFKTQMIKIKERKDLGYIDLPLEDAAFDDLEVLCSPLMTEYGKKKVKELLEKNAPNAIIKQSNLKIRQR